MAAVTICSLKSISYSFPTSSAKHQCLRFSKILRHYAQEFEDTQHTFFAIFPYWSISSNSDLLKVAEGMSITNWESENHPHS